MTKSLLFYVGDVWSYVNDSIAGLCAFCRVQFGEKGKLCLVRFLNSTVMVRVGGGWITLASFLDNNDPCRGNSMTESLSPLLAVCTQSVLANHSC